MATTVRVIGMSCGGCVSSLTKFAQEAVPGCKVLVDLASGTLAIKGVDDLGRLKSIVEDAGFEYGGPVGAAA